MIITNLFIKVTVCKAEQGERSVRQNPCCLGGLAERQSEPELEFVGIKATSLSGNKLRYEKDRGNLYYYKEIEKSVEINGQK